MVHMHYLYNYTLQQRARLTCAAIATPHISSLFPTTLDNYHNRHFMALRQTSLEFCVYSSFNLRNHTVHLRHISD